MSETIEYAPSSSASRSWFTQTTELLPLLSTAIFLSTLLFVLDAICRCRITTHEEIVNMLSISGLYAMYRMFELQFWTMIAMSISIIIIGHEMRV